MLACRTISSSVSRKSQFSLPATSFATRDLPVPEKPVMTRLVICLRLFIAGIFGQYIEKARLEQGSASQFYVIFFNEKGGITAPLL